MYCGRGFDSRHLHHIKEYNMFKWLKKKKEEPKIKFYPEEYLDGIEESLWEIKDQYDLPTEEVACMVQNKRENLEYMHRVISQKEKYE